MIVLDASAVVELLLRTHRGGLVAARIESSSEQLHAPHLIDVEVTQVLRRYEGAGIIASHEAEEALRNLHDSDIHRYGHEMLLDRVWQLRHNVTAYDAVYLALAEALDAALLTCDARLASAPAHGARVELLEL